METLMETAENKPRRETTLKPIQIPTPVNILDALRSKEDPHTRAMRSLISRVDRQDPWYEGCADDVY